jgi:peptidyl-prolyl cis-trans isomerase A (cyclophilin A)
MKVGKKILSVQVRRLFLCFCRVLVLMLGMSAFAHGNTIVRVSTTFGDFSIELFDSIAPVTVQNFLNYVNRGAFNSTYFHRLDKGFVLQGGGYQFIPFEGPREVPADPPIVNEFNVSNTRGTLAMAKVGGDPDSATSQWFVNLADNSENLDNQNGGFTVFGRVLGDGMLVMDTINGLSVFNLGSLHPQVPLHNFAAFESLAVKNFVTMNAEVVQRYSSALSVFEYHSGLLMVPVDGGEALGAYSLNLSLHDDQSGIVFRLNPDSLVPLAIRPIGMATFSADDNKLRIPVLELNNNGSVEVISNVVLRLSDADNWLFILESYE